MSSNALALLQGYSSPWNTDDLARTCAQAIGDLSNAFTQGKTTLVAGVSPAVSVSNLAAGDSIIFSVRNRSGAANTVGYAAPDADRVLGASGSFKIRAFAAGDAPNAADISTLDFIVERG